MHKMTAEDIANGILDFVERYPEAEYTMESLLRNIRQNNDQFGEDGVTELEIIKLLEGKIEVIDGQVSYIPKLFVLKK